MLLAALRASPIPGYNFVSSFHSDKIHRAPFEDINISDTFGDRLKGVGAFEGATWGDVHRDKGKPGLGPCTTISLSDETTDESSCCGNGYVFFFGFLVVSEQSVIPENPHSARLPAFESSA